MSPLIRRPIGGDWLVWLERGRWQLLRRRGGRLGAYEVLDASTWETDAESEAWADAAESALRRVRPYWPARLTVAVASEAAPGFDIVLPDPPAPRAVADAFLAARRDQVLGGPGDGWRVACDERVRTGRAVAFAMPKVVAERVSSSARSFTRCRLVPAACWAAQRLLSKALAFDGWFLLEEVDRTIALRLDGARVRHVALLSRDAATASAAPLELALWERRHGLGAGAALVIAVAAGVQPASTSAGEKAAPLFAQVTKPVADFHPAALQRATT